MVGGAAGHQLGVGAVLHHAPLVEDEDAVGADHAREPVGEDEGRAALHQPVERFLDHRLALGVDGRERLVQDQDRRVAQERARDGDALALAAREPHPPLAHDGLVAVGQPRDELLRIGGAGGRRELGRRRVGLAHAQVLLDGAVEEIGVLVDHREPAPQLVERQVTHVVAAEQHPPLLGIVEAEEEPRHGGLARAARPHDAHALAGLDLEGEPVVGGPPAAGIGELHPLEGQRRREPGPVDHARVATTHERPGVEEIEDALGRRDAEHALMQEDAQLAQGAEDLDAQHQDDQERGQLHLPRPHAIGAQREGHRRADGDAGVRDAAGEGVGPEHAHGAVEEGVALVLEQLRPRPTLAEGLEGRQALHRIEELGAEGGVRLLAPPAVPAVEPMPGDGGDERDQRGEEERQRDG